MLSKLFNKRKKWFTLIEVLLICSAFAILVSGVIIAINRAYTFMNDTKIRIRATNLAREWVEMMFNIRDTNWRKNSWDRDANWLDTWEWRGEHFREWLYTLQEWVTRDWEKYFYATRLTNFNDTASYERYYNGWFRNARQEWLIEFNWNYNYMEYSWGNRVEETRNIQDLLWNEINFYRIVRVYWLYRKDVDNTTATAENLYWNSWIPLEMRFCVKVFYQNNTTQNSSELCSIMTNFME